MTEEAATAKRLFDGERWSEAALGLYRVYKGETGDDPGNRQIAQYHLAIALYRLKFYQASYGIFSEIADKPNHLKFNETLLWLSKLATQLPEPADIVERVGKYTGDADRAFQEPPADRSLLAAQLPARSLQVPKPPVRRGHPPLHIWSTRKSKYFVQAQFFTGISHVQLTKSVPAVQAFQKVVTAIDEGVEGVEDEARMRDLAFLSMARTYYSASIKLDENNTPTHRRHQALGGGEVLEQGRRRAASTGSTVSSRSRGRTSWPATFRTRSATSTPSKRPTSRSRSTQRRRF